MVRMRRLHASLALACLLAIACDASNGDPTAPGGAASEELSGRYELSTHVDLTGAGILPDLANHTFSALSQLAETPAHAILSLLEAAQVPIVSTVLALIPDVLLGYFEGWIDAYVFARLYEGVPVAEQLVGLVDDLASLVTRFEIVTELELGTPGDTGDAAAGHRLVGVAFTLGGQRWLTPVPPALADVVSAPDLTCNAVHIFESSPAVENGRLDVGDHDFGLPLGTLALATLDQALAERFGVPDLRGALGLLVDCSALAQTVASSCLNLICVGHQAELLELCDASLDLVAAQVEERVRALDFRALHFARGEARMWDAASEGGALDGRIDRLDRGTWDLGLNVGAGEHPVSATFVGHRTGDVGHAER